MGKSEVTNKHKSRRKWLWRLVQRWKRSLFLSHETLRSEKHLLNLLCFTISHDFTMGKSEVTNKHKSRRKWLWRLVQRWKRSLLLSPETFCSEKHLLNLCYAWQFHMISLWVKGKSEVTNKHKSRRKWLWRPVQRWKRFLFLSPEFLCSEKHLLNLLCFTISHDFTMGKSEVTNKHKSRRRWLWHLVQRWKWSLLLSPETLCSEKHLLNLLCFTISHDFTMGKSEVVTNKHKSRRKWLWRLVQRWTWSLLLSPETLCSEKHLLNLLCFTISYDFTMGKSEVTSKHKTRRKWLWRLVQRWKRSLFLSPETFCSEKHLLNLL